MSQEDLANKIGIKRANIGSYEEGRCEPGLETVNKIAKHFCITMDDLVNKEMFVEREIRFK